VGPLPPVAGALRIEVQCSLGSDVDVLTRLFFAYGGGAPSETVLADLNGTVNTGWVDNITPLQAADTTMTQITSYDLSSEDAASATTEESHAGTRMGTGLPAQVAFGLNFKIARRYRGGKPKTFLPVGCIADLATPQTWTSGFVTAVEDGFAALIAAIAGFDFGGFDMGGQINISYFKGFTNVMYPSGRYKVVPSLRVGGPVTDPIVAIAPNLKTVTQRRRTTNKR
jgi:hypothetical protein